MTKGDHAYKKNKSLPLTEQMISPVPDVRTLRIDPATDPFMVLACDGIWNSMSSQEVVDFVAERIAKAPLNISSVCEEVRAYVFDCFELLVAKESNDYDRDQIF